MSNNPWRSIHVSLRAALASPPGTPPVYEPQRGFLSLLNTCDGRAILSWEGVWPGDGTHARWAWWLKDRIDRRFVRKYR
jgi:selenide,water dikinase